MSTGGISRWMQQTVIRYCAVKYIGVSREPQKYKKAQSLEARAPFLESSCS